MPFFSITVVASVAILVEADSEDEAIDCAFDEADFTHAEHKETLPAKELSSKQEIDSAKRHAEQFIKC